MNRLSPILIDVAVIGAGPAGISACLELDKSSNMNIALFDRSTIVGGMPRSCHFPFGMRDQKIITTGTKYANRLERLVHDTSVKVHTESTVVNIHPAIADGEHIIDVASTDGYLSYQCKNLILATGCFEISQGARMLPGTRPTGVFTTGMLQDIVKIRHQKFQRRVVIVGSELVSLSSILTLREAGATIVAMIEEDDNVHCYPPIAKVMSSVYGFPIYRHTEIQSILGIEQVEGIELKDKNEDANYTIECDCILITGKFRPYSALIDETSIERDPNTFGPSVDTNFMTSVANIYAVGNVIRGVHMHDLCALEGKAAAKNIINKVKGTSENNNDGFYLSTESPIEYIAPQKILLDATTTHKISSLTPGCAIQLIQTLKNPTIEAWSGSQLLWKKSYRRLLANSRISIPIWEFDFNQIEINSTIILKVT